MNDPHSLMQLVFYVPVNEADAVKNAVFEAGAGHVGAYDRCCWETTGRGQFRPLPGSTPALGKHNALEHVDELRVETVVSQTHLPAAIEALLDAHPYETPAYSFWPINRDTHPQQPVP